MRKNYLVGMILMVLLIAQSLFAQTITMTLNGQTIASEVAPIQENGTTLVPLRMVSENLGAKVAYDQVKKLITISKGKATYTIKLKDEAMPGEAKVINGVTMVPIRMVSEQLGVSVVWDGKTKTVVMTTQENTFPIATIKIKNYGIVEAELYSQYAPRTVENFISLADKQFYDGLTFHRIIKDFVIQGGCPNGDGTGGPGYTIPGEFVANGYDANRLAHVKGILSMARSSQPNSGGSQFFIVTDDAPHLNGYYAAFGKVIKGMEIIDQLNQVKTNDADQPIQPVIIESVRVSMMQ